ncbi:MAG: hypothetical protein J6U86_05635, partial [Clostridia bacterium]|nr:hypothetical protein [Clostridia bacterium]
MNRGEQIQTTNKDRTITEKGEWARRILDGALRVAAAYALGRAQLPFGALPFGFAALSATGGHVAFVAAGLALSLIERENAAAYLASYAIVLLLRAVVCVVGDTANKSEGLFREHISIRAIVCAVGAFCVGLYRLSEGGFLYYDLFGAIISICVSAVFACLFYTLENERAGDFARTLGLTALLCAVAWGIRNVELYGISIGVLFSMLASLIVMRKKGLLHGTLIALSTGLCVSLSFAPLFVFGTVLYSFLGTVTPFFGAVASLGVGVAWGIYIQGIGALSALLPALLAANFVFLTVDRLYLSLDKAALFHEKTEQVALTPTLVTNDISLARLNDTAHRIKLLCEGFSSLSDMLIKADISDTEQDLCFEL